MADIPIVQYPDANGSRAYAKTHVQAIDGLDDKLAPFAKSTDLSPYARTDQSTTFNGDLITKKGTNFNTLWVNNVAYLNGNSYLNNVTISGFLNGQKLSNYALKSDIPTSPDLSGYAKTTDLSNYATKDDLQKVNNEITTLQSPDGSTWFLSVDNNGRLSTSKLIQMTNDEEQT